MKATTGPSATKAPAKGAKAEKTLAEKTLAEKTLAETTATEKTPTDAPAAAVAPAAGPAAPETPAPAAPARKAARKAPAPAAAPADATAAAVPTTPKGPEAAPPSTPVKATKAPAKAARPTRPAQPAVPPLDPADVWSEGELADVRGELAVQARELRGEIDDAERAADDLQQNAVGEGPGDEADAGSKTFEREHEMSLANNSRDLLQQVERALSRVDDGTYGRCESCGNAIPKPRLQAFPRATLCVSCKQREERR